MAAKLDAGPGTDSPRDRAAAIAAADAAAGTAEVDGAELLARARSVFRFAAESLSVLESRLDEDFLRAVDILAEARRVIVSGIGKSGIIGRKVAATLTSTGTPAVYLHPVEGMHGDLGIVSRGDAAILISKSGESDELAGLVEFLSRLGVSMIALTGRPRSHLGRAATVALDCAVPVEACPFDLAPTTSATAALVMGDALAVALLVRKGFSREDFARLHPGGALGRKLTLRVDQVMLTEGLPTLPPEATMRQCVVLLAERRGTVAVVDGDGRVVGVVTAGDLTRLMEREEQIFDVPVSRVMNRSPKVISPDALASAAVFQMETHGVMAMPVVNDAGRPVGMVHLHDLLRAGAA